MTDREAFLRAIAAAPADDLPRLVYADFLDERRECDRDLATAEFVRLTCGRTRKDRKPRKTIAPDAAGWLATEWRRLVPGLTADYWVKETRGGGSAHHWSCRTCLVARVPFLLPSRLNPCGYLEYSPAVSLSFDRGFLWSASWRAPQLGPKIAGLISADQPLAFQSGPGALPEFEAFHPLLPLPGVTA